MNPESTGEPLNQMEIASRFHQWIRLMHPDKVKFNPKFIAIKHENVLFGMSKHMGRFVVSITTLLHDLANNPNKTIPPC
jgi:hypothetical protein